MSLDIPGTLSSPPLKPQTPISGTLPPGNPLPPHSNFRSPSPLPGSVAREGGGDSSNLLPSLLRCQNFSQSSLTPGRAGWREGRARGLPGLASQECWGQRAELGVCVSACVAASPSLTGLGGAAGGSRRSGKGPRPRAWGSHRRGGRQWWREREQAAQRGAEAPRAPLSITIPGPNAARACPALGEAEVGRRTGRRAPPRPVPRM